MRATDAQGRAPDELRVMAALHSERAGVAGVAVVLRLACPGPDTSAIDQWPVARWPRCSLRDRPDPVVLYLQPSATPARRGRVGDQVSAGSGEKAVVARPGGPRCADPATPGHRRSALGGRAAAGARIGVRLGPRHAGGGEQGRYGGKDAQAHRPRKLAPGRRKWLRSDVIRSDMRRVHRAEEYPPPRGCRAHAALHPGSPGPFGHGC